MPRNGSGVYSLPSGINPVVTQTLITSNWANTTLADVAAAITASIARDGQTVPTANLPMGGFIHTGVGNALARDNYLTLGQSQDGSDYRLTSVTGVNTITATLVGGQLLPNVGQMVQLIPTSTNTGSVTLAINGGASRPILTDAGNSLGAGNLVNGRPYLLTFNGSNYVLTTGAGASGFAQSAMSGWDRPTPTGPYPAITIVNPSTVGIPAGTGRIIKASNRDLSGVTEVAWSAQNVTITNVAVAFNTTLAVNSAGAIVQFTGQFNAAWARDNIILGIVSHINGVVNAVITRPAIYGDMTYASFDIGTLLQGQIVSGGQVVAAASAFHLNVNAGAIFTVGGDQADVNSPNILDFAAQLDISFFPVTGNNTVAAATQNIPVTNYDPNGAGTVTPIGGAATQTSIHRLYLGPAGQFVFAYGQQTYADLASALSQIGVDAAANKPASRLVNFTLLASLVIQKNCLALSDTSTCRIVNAGGFNFAIGSAGSMSEAPINGLLYGRTNATWGETIPMPRGAAGTLRMVPYYTNTLQRWLLGANDTPESGSNAGSDWELRAFNDAGTLLGSALRIARATQKATFLANPTIDIATAPTLFLNGNGNPVNLRRAAFTLDNIGQAVISINQDNDTVKADWRMGATGGLEVRVGGTQIFNVSAAGNLTLVGASSTYTAALHQIQASTADAADNAAIFMCGGGTSSVTRGAFIGLYGNENAQTGTAILSAGNAAGALIKLDNGDVQVTNGRLYGLAIHNPASAMTGTTNQYVGSGTYTPTITNTSNVSASSAPTPLQFIRVGNVVTVSGQINVTPTAAAANTEVRITLPVASNLAAVGNLVGTLETTTGAGNARVTGAIVGETSVDLARVLFDAQGTASHQLFCMFTYVVLP